MNRKSIFDKLSTLDLRQDLSTIWALQKSVLVKEDVIIYPSSKTTRPYNLEEFIDSRRLIPKWKHNNRCVHCSDIIAKLDILQIVES
jgi:hypothetical protein